MTEEPTYEAFEEVKPKKKKKEIVIDAFWDNFGKILATLLSVFMGIGAIFEINVIIPQVVEKATIATIEAVERTSEKQVKKILKKVEVVKEETDKEIKNLKKSVKKAKLRDFFELAKKEESD